MTSLHAIRAVAACAVLFVGADVSLAQARALQTSALINQQLDQRIAFDLKNTPLPQVLKSIEEKTGVPVRVADDVYDVLPWGTQTPITANVDNVSLRDALTAIVGKLGLRMDLRDEWLELSPHPALRRIGRRATLQELKTLDLLSREPSRLDGGPLTLLDVTHAIDTRLMEAGKATPPGDGQPSDIVVELRPVEDVDPAKATILITRGMTLADALDAVAAQTKMSWYPWGDSVVVLGKRDVVRSLLDRRVSLRYDGVDVAQVLSDLANRTGVEFSIEPGAIQRVTPEFRIIKLTADASVRQSLESLQGYTGLGYVVTDEGVYIWNQNSTPTGGSGGRPRVAATVAVGHGAQVLVYEDQLSAAARETLKQQRQSAIDKLEASLTGATTMPATQPTEEIHHN